MENDENLVSIKTEKVSGKLVVHGTITHINQLKRIYFPKVREIVELI